MKDFSRKVAKTQREERKPGLFVTMGREDSGYGLKKGNGWGRKPQDAEEGGSPAQRETMGKPPVVKESQRISRLMR